MDLAAQRDIFVDVFQFLTRLQLENVKLTCRRVHQLIRRRFATFPLGKLREFEKDDEFQLQVRLAAEHSYCMAGKCGASRFKSISRVKGVIPFLWSERAELNRVGVVINTRESAGGPLTDGERVALLQIAKNLFKNAPSAKMVVVGDSPPNSKFPKRPTFHSEIIQELLFAFLSEPVSFVREMALHSQCHLHFDLLLDDCTREWFFGERLQSRLRANKVRITLRFATGQRNAEVFRRLVELIRTFDDIWLELVPTMDYLQKYWTADELRELITLLKKDFFEAKSANEYFIIIAGLNFPVEYEWNWREARDELLAELDDTPPLINALTDERLTIFVDRFYRCDDYECDTRANFIRLQRESAQLPARTRARASHAQLMESKYSGSYVDEPRCVYFNGYYNCFCNKYLR